MPNTTKEGAKCVMRMQVTAVRKSLMSVSKICDVGHKVIFESNGGHIEHLSTGQRTQFDRKGGVYTIKVNAGERDLH